MQSVPRAVLLAQVLSLLLCVMGVTSGTLANKGIDAPTTQSLLNYLLLTCVCGAVLAKQHGWKLPPSRNAWYIYALLALLDVEANFIVTKAYQYTSITSVTLLDCFTIPAVMLLSCIILRGGASYGMGHLWGALLSVAGLVCLVLTDQYSKTAGPKPILGDVLVLLGATVYAVCNVSQERLLYDTSRWELLASVSAYASCFSGVQALILEHHAWTGSQWDGAAVGALVGFALALFCFSLLIPSVLVLGGSTVLNLSLLTSDLWAAGARGIFFGGFGGTAPYFFFAFVLEVLGIGLYTLSGEARKIPPTCHSEREMGELTHTASGAHDGDDVEEQGNVDEASRLLGERGHHKQDNQSQGHGGPGEGSRLLGKQVPGKHAVYEQGKQHGKDGSRGGTKKWDSVQHDGCHAGVGEPREPHTAACGYACEARGGSCASNGAREAKGGTRTSDGSACEARVGSCVSNGACEAKGGTHTSVGSACEARGGSCASNGAREAKGGTRTSDGKACEARGGSCASNGAHEGKGDTCSGVQNCQGQDSSVQPYTSGIPGWFECEGESMEGQGACEGRPLEHGVGVQGSYTPMGQGILVQGGEAVNERSGGGGLTVASEDGACSGREPQPQTRGAPVLPD